MPQNRKATVSFTPPIDDGGAPITGYTVITRFYANSTPTGQTTPTVSTSVDVLSLTNGTTYDFLVYATNAIGDGPNSLPSNPVTPATVPDPPIIGTATGGYHNAVVTFTPPVDNGGNVIIGYTATSTPGNITASNIASPITVNGLTNGTTYTFTVHATNSIGNSIESAPTAPEAWFGLVMNLAAIQFEMCPTGNITIDPHLVGSPSGHTFQWTQLSGNPVTYVSFTTQPIVTYSSATQDDKVFQLIIDANTVVQQVGTITVSSTPQDTFASYFSGAIDDILVPAAANQLNVSFVQNPPLRTSGQGYNVLYTDPTAIFWSLPTDTSNMIGIAVERNTAGSFYQVAYAAIADTNRYAPIASPIDTYRFRIDFRNNVSVYLTPFRMPAQTLALADDNAGSGSAIGNRASTVTLINTRLVSNSPANDDTALISLASIGARNSASTLLLTKQIVNNSIYDDSGTLSASAVTGTFSSVTTIPGHVTVGG